MKKNKSTFRQKLQRFMLYAVCLFVLSTSLAVIILGFVPIHTSAFMLNKHLDDYQSDRAFTAIQQQWRNNDSISPHISHAVIAAEDQRFYQHYGFDINAMYLAIKHRLSGGKLRGASTISQQVAKNLFLSSSRSLWRKGFEAWFTLLIEAFWSKERILLVYVNIAEFGDHLYGVEAASHYYFSVSAKRLSASQAALLAASLPNPEIYQVDNPSEQLRQKQAWILQQMRNLAYL